jgi:hypothetical protein
MHNKQIEIKNINNNYEQQFSIVKNKNKSKCLVAITEYKRRYTELKLIAKQNPISDDDLKTLLDSIKSQYKINLLSCTSGKLLKYILRKQNNYYKQLKLLKNPMIENKNNKFVFNFNFDIKPLMDAMQEFLKPIQQLKKQNIKDSAELLRNIKDAADNSKRLLKGNWRGLKKKWDNYKIFDKEGKEAWEDGVFFGVPTILYLSVVITWFSLFCSYLIGYTIVNIFKTFGRGIYIGTKKIKEMREEIKFDDATKKDAILDDIIGKISDTKSLFYKNFEDIKKLTGTEINNLCIIDDADIECFTSKYEKKIIKQFIDQMDNALLKIENIDLQPTPDDPTLTALQNENRRLKRLLDNMEADEERFNQMMDGIMFEKSGNDIE